MIQLPPDFRDFLKLLNTHRVKYLLVGGHAVNYHGHVRPTGDMDIWVAQQPENADKLVAVFREFGFDVPELSREQFIHDHQLTRIGVSPLRIEVLTTLSGVEFDQCYRSREVKRLDGVDVSFICLRDLLVNKRASGRNKDLADLDYLPSGRRRTPSRRKKRK